MTRPACWCCPCATGGSSGDRKFVLNCRLEESPDAEVLAGFIKLHYANPLNVPPELVLPYQPEEARAAGAVAGAAAPAGRRGRGSSREDRVSAGNREQVRGPGNREEGTGNSGGWNTGAGAGLRARGCRRAGHPPHPEDAAPARPVRQESISFTVPLRGHKAELLAHRDAQRAGAAAHRAAGRGGRLRRHAGAESAGGAPGPGRLPAAHRGLRHRQPAGQAGHGRDGGVHRRAQGLARSTACSTSASRTRPTTTPCCARR